MIYNLLNKIRYEAIKHPMVSMSSFGDIALYEDKASIKYPYVNLDIVTSNVVNYLKTYTIRIYVCDRNDVLTSYNKTELILDDILKSIDTDRYVVNYFTLNFKDVVNGVFADFEIQVPLEGSCTYDTLFNVRLLEDGKFLLLENGDLQILEL